MKITRFLRCLFLTCFVSMLLVIPTWVAGANEPIQVSAYQTPIKVACVGDSITWGVGAKAIEVNSYPSQLQRMLDDKTWQVKNFGVSGATMLNQGDSPYQKKGAMQSALQFKPDVVIIMLGTNDTKPQNWKFKDEIIADYKEMIGKFKAANEKVRIFVCRPVWVAGKGNFGINEENVLLEIPMLDQIVKDENTGMIDMHEVLKDKAQLIPDRVHPNENGYTLMAKEVYKTLIGKEFNGEMAAELHSLWGGYEKVDFQVGDRSATLVLPKNPAPGNPWIWRTEFFGAEPQTEVALLAKGWHVAYYNVSGMYGCPAAMDAMDVFYKYMVSERKLSDKVTLEGFSRGGLYAFNWAARNPAQVRSIYADAPVLDFKSWPAGKGKGQGSPNDWKNCLRSYQLTEEQALEYKLNPIDNLKPLADAKIPIISVCGDADKTVPFEENTALAEKRYQELGGEMKVITKLGGDHHPHSLKDPTPIVDFILSH